MRLSPKQKELLSLGSPKERSLLVALEGVSHVHLCVKCNVRARLSPLSFTTLQRLPMFCPWLGVRTHARTPAHTHARTMLSRRRSSRWAPSPSLPCIALSRRRSSRWAPSPSSPSCSPPAPPRFRCALPRRRATAPPRWFQGIRSFRLRRLRTGTALRARH